MKERMLRQRPTATRGTRYLAFILVALLAGCAGPARTVDPVDAVGPVEDTVRVDAAFDIAPYDDPSPPEDTGIVHDVPASLMDNRADVGVSREVDGFRVQVFSTLDLNEAASMEEAVRNFWTTTSTDDPERVAGLETPVVYRLFRQPYYRIRVGDFATRSGAERVARVLVTGFSGAFVVPDRVTVRK